MASKIPKLCIVIFFLFSLLKYATAQEYTLKIGTLAPAGSIWYELMEDWIKNIKAKLGSRIKIVIYPGGVMGDEDEMIKKIKIGQIHAGAFTINGIKKIAPQLGVLDLPFLFKNYNEIDYIVDKYMPEFEAFFERKDYKLLTFAEHGFVYFFSKKDINGFRDLAATRFWVWKGEKTITEIAKVLGTSPIFLLVPDLLSGLETGMIESFQTSPMACLSLQWCKLVKSMINYPYRYEPGVVVIYKKFWDEIPKDIQNVIEDETKKMQKTFNQRIRESNKKSMEKLKELGIKMVSPTQDDINWFEGKIKEQVWFSQNTEYPQDFLRNIIRELERIRKQ